MQNSKSELSRLVVAIVGCGTVGGGAARLILQNQDHFRKMAGVDLVLKYLVDKNFSHARSLGLPETLFCTELDTALADPEVGVVVELVGGTGFAKTLFEKALAAGKHVVTANKALLAHHGKELFALARRQERTIGFEASCGGGIPIIRALYDGLLANEIQALYGIVNGTCNFILSQMAGKGQSYADALRDAQSAGFAEADPSLDVQGGDSAHKIGILANLAFGAAIKPEDISVRGIDTLQITDVNAGADLGYVIKLIAQAQRTASGLSVRVEPSFISRHHPLAWVSGSFNALSVYGNAVGHTLYYGRGAGAMPTASAVVSDMLSIGTGAYPLQFARLGNWLDRTVPVRATPESEIVRKYYLRFLVQDKPGMLAKMTAVLGTLDISVASIHQPEVAEPQDGDSADGMVTVIIITHPTSEQTIRQAAREICALHEVADQASLIPILDEHPEFKA
jgi:homoserine dehydrogenase